MEGSNYSLIIVPAIFSIVILFITIVAIISLVSTKRNGTEVIATIKSIDKHINSEGYSEYIIKCSCPYENVDEARLYYNFKFDAKNVKIGDQINCIYNKKKNYFMTSANSRGIAIMVVILVIVELFIIGGVLFRYFISGFIK